MAASDHLGVITDTSDHLGVITDTGENIEAFSTENCNYEISNDKRDPNDSCGGTGQLGLGLGETHCGGTGQTNSCERKTHAGRPNDDRMSTGDTDYGMRSIGFEDPNVGGHALMGSWLVPEPVDLLPDSLTDGSSCETEPRQHEGGYRGGYHGIIPLALT